MRIVSGNLKGRVIAAPKGRGTRPTSDRARETLFNVLAHAAYAPALDGARVIDLFAGSGALGFEALSRGAAYCLFVETEAGARGAIRSNTLSLQQDEASQLYRRSAVDLGARSAGVGAPFTFAFLDPPYGKGLVEPCLRSLISGNWLAEEALIVLETGVQEGAEAVRDGAEGGRNVFETVTKDARFELVGERVIGAAKFWFLRLRV